MRSGLLIASHVSRKVLSGLGLHSHSCGVCSVFLVCTCGPYPCAIQILTGYRNASKQMMESPCWKRVLRTALAMGNYFNNGSTKGITIGFK